jgi:hypothetical protein
LHYLRPRNGGIDDAKSDRPRFAVLTAGATNDAAAGETALARARLELPRHPHIVIGAMCQRVRRACGDALGAERASSARKINLWVTAPSRDQHTFGAMTDALAAARAMPDEKRFFPRPGRATNRARILEIAPQELHTADRSCHLLTAILH